MKNLGVMFDSAMTMSSFIGMLCKSLNFQLYKIASIRQFLTTEVTRQLVTSLILSKLDYCNALLAGVTKDKLSKLQMIQNNAARLITKKRKSEHVTPLLKQLHWLPVEQRIVYKISLLCFKCLHKIAPSYLSDLLTLYTPNRALRSSRDTMRLNRQETNLMKCGERAFMSVGPRMWNELPLNIREAPTLAQFKSLLKTHLFKQASIV